MKTIAVLQADFHGTSLGTRSRLAEPLAGTPILRRTIQRLKESKRIDATLVVAPEHQLGFCKDLLCDLDVQVHAVSGDPPPWARLVRASRKWVLDGWRGGVGGSTVFDEFVDCRVLAGLLAMCPADAVLGVPAAAPLFDPALADQMIEHRERTRDEARLTFTQAIPGIAGIVLDAGLVRELATALIPISWLFTYKPDQPQKDLIFQSACLDIPAPFRFATGRLMADTDTAMETLRAMFAQRERWSLTEIGQFLVERDEYGVAEFPREVEIELTTDDPFPESLLVPRGERLGRSGALELDLVRRIRNELVHRDDALCVLGGFGDPLCRADLREALTILRPAEADEKRVFGLCVKTSAVELTPEVADQVIMAGVEVLNVSLDAWTDETYARVKGTKAGMLAVVRERLEGFARMQHERGSPLPIVVPELVKAKENIHELDSFFDGWLRQSGAAGIVGYSNYSGQLPDRSAFDMRPPNRIPCRRLRTRCTILCDGRVTLCDQDFRGHHTVGNVRDASIKEIWQSARFVKTRDDHFHQRFKNAPLCETCTEWHRP